MRRFYELGTILSLVAAIGGCVAVAIILDTATSDVMAFPVTRLMILCYFVGTLLSVLSFVVFSMLYTDRCRRENRGWRTVTGKLI